MLSILIKMRRCKMSRDYLVQVSGFSPDSYNGEKYYVEGNKCTTCKEHIQHHEPMNMMCPYIAITPDTRNFDKGICRTCGFATICHRTFRDPISAIQYYFLGFAIKEKKEDKYIEEVPKQEIPIHNEEIIPSRGHKTKKLRGKHSPLLTGSKTE